MKLILIAALAVSVASPLAAQSVEESEHPAQNDAKMDKMLKDAERDRGAARENSHDSREALRHFGSCVAKASPREASRVLAMDFTTTSYRTGLKLLGDDAAKRCANPSFGVGVLRSSNLLFAGEVAEALIETDDAPLAIRLTKAASGSATLPYSFTDRVAICVVRSVPGDVAALLATDRDSAAETAALNGLAVPMGMCAKAANAKKPLSINPAGLRAMLATASYRSLRAAEVNS